MEVISLFTEFVKRPGLDKLGRPIRLRINYFEITDFPFNNVYHYEIVILPEVPPTLNRKIFRMSDVTMPEDNTNNVDRRPPRIFKIRIKKVAEIHMEEINMFLDRRGLMTLNVLTGIMALNGSQSLNEGVEAWQVKKVLNKRTIEELRDISERDRLKIENFLKNLKIYATHDENALNRRFRISKVTNTSDSNTTTFDDNGNQTDVASYFQRKYNMQLQHPFLPCIVIREETYLPLEVCNVVETRQIQYDCQPSQSRANKINQGIGILNYQQNEYYMQRFDFRLPLVQQLGSWACTVFGSENDFPMSAIQKFIRELQVWLKAGNDAKAQPQLILCILPNTGVSLYDAEIKRVGDTVTGVVTLCIQSRNMFAIKKQYCVNVYLKINAKLGGMNSFINPSQLLFVSESPTIILGASVIHPVPGDTSRPSIAAVAASIDAMASRYVASIRVQQEYEIKAIKVVCKSLEVTFVVAQKRHHTRFFPIDKKDGDRAGNCLPGTSRPTHYRVLFDENGFSSDALQILTYNLCYSFARCTRAVSIVPSVYYARLVCLIPLVSLTLIENFQIAEKSFYGVRAVFEDDANNE
uniref:Piwi domain-containing protein n=1 Tax=Rhizophagus irregularis (strain DAOM 181602 / DAOM 197198 / MUCL 43194) TaxID=747089 RepID=U9UQ28_RHIID